MGDLKIGLENLLILKCW